MSQAMLGGEPFHNANLFSNYYLTDRIGDLDGWDCDTEATAAFERLQTLWEFEGGLVDSYGEDELLASWIDRVLDVLGFDWLAETTLPDGGGYTDRLLFDSPETRRTAAERKRDGEPSAAFGRASAVLEAKQWDADFSRRFSEGRSYYDASQQLKYYLERTPERLQWGILTNGRKWRLYGTKDYATEVYYEVDLPALLTASDLEAFKYFYAMFRPQAFAERAGTSFLDRVWSESETAAQELGADLQDNVFTALRLLGEGFLATNDLAIDPDDQRARAELKEQSLVLLYRLMFILYAESRGLIHPDDPDKQSEYDEHFSLEQRLLDIHESITSGDSYEDYSGYSTQLWGRLEDLFGLIDEGEAALGIPPYNGGLFDDSTHAFLAENEVSDRYLAEVIHRLGTTEGEGEKAGQPVIADYADLDTRHLGSIYEGLLEHEFRIAPEQYAAVSADGGEVWKPATEVSVADAVETVEAGQLYVVNDDGERKATGAYYTPDYVVSYIVEETIDPLIAEIKADLAGEGMEPGDTGYFAPFFERVKELTVLDPAMGSGHFLTSATAYLTEQVMEVVREMEIQSYDEQDLRRQIAKECIYGVDINGMAVELGKLSMWLETLAADKPLAFLDHHLKAGNSLVGSDITEVLADDSENGSGQLTLSQSFARARQQTLGHVMELMQDLLAIDNDALVDIKSMEQLYDEIRDDPLYIRLFEIANVHTAEQFGVDVPAEAYEEMAGAIDDTEKWAGIQGEEWFTKAQTLAGEQSFFHWELEYPEVFFDKDGEKLGGAGFDAVIGNPPYVQLSMEDSTTKGFKKYLKSKYNSSMGRLNTFGFFMSLGTDITKEKGQMSMIVPNTILNMTYYGELRNTLLSKTHLRSILSIDYLPFEDAIVENVVLVHQVGGSKSNVKFRKYKKEGVEQSHEVSQTVFENWHENVISTNLTSENLSIYRSTQEDTTELGKLSEINQAIALKHDRNRWIHNKKKGSNFVPVVDGRDISRYHIDGSDKYLEYDDSAIHSCKRRDIFEADEKILFRRVGEGIIACYDDDQIYGLNTVVVINLIEDYNKIPYKYILTILNSKFGNWYFKTFLKSSKEVFSEIQARQVERIPIVVPNEENVCQRKNVDGIEDYESIILEIQNKNADYTTVECLCILADRIRLLKNKKSNLNLELFDHLGAYDDGQPLAEIGLSQPPRGSANSILQQTATDKPNLRVGTASVVRESPNTVEIRLTARYKPGEQDDLDESEFEVDQWGYTETDPQPALRLTDLTSTEADLIAAFVPVAVDEAGGFAGFRDTATKTNSLVDRLRKLTLPRVADVEAGLEGYIKTKARAEELEAKIESTDALIDEIVYELYGLTDEEIEIVEEAVGE